LGGSRFQVSLSKKFTRPRLTVKKLGVVTHTCHPSYSSNPKIGGSGSEAMQDSISKITVWEAWVKPECAYLASAKKKKKKKKVK
jgi:hypothetical protein